MKRSAETMFDGGFTPCFVPKGTIAWKIKPYPTPFSKTISPNIALLQLPNKIFDLHIFSNFKKFRPSTLNKKKFCDTTHCLSPN